MPPLANKGKTKGRSDARRSRSRNTTPSSVLSAGTAPLAPIATAYLEIDTAKLLVPQSPTYSDVLDKLGSGANVLDPKQFDSLLESLKTLSSLAEARSQACDAAMRELVNKRKEVAEEQRENERMEREAEQRRARAKKDVEDEDHDDRGRKSAKVKKRKERSRGREEAEERPLAHGAHGVAKQDGSDIKAEGKSWHNFVFGSESTIIFLVTVQSLDGVFLFFRCRATFTSLLSLPQISFLLL